MTTRKKGIIALFVLSCIWGSFGIPIRYLSDHFTILQQIYLRLAVAATLAYIIFYKDLKLKKLFSLTKKEYIVLVFRILIFYGFAVPLYAQAYLLTAYSNVSFLSAIPTTAVLGFILLQEKITFKKIILIAVAIIGILFITVKDASHFFIWGRGDTLTLISDFFFSLSYVSRRWHTKLFNNKELAVIMIIFGTLLTILLSVFFDHSLPQLNQFKLITNLVILIGGILNVASTFFTNYGFQYVEAALASNIVSMESFFAVIFGFFFFKEIPTVQSFFGGLLILASVVFLSKEEEKIK